jgi:LDH2 family malate/lactate/ureidoglycolate dehydrogenase
MKNVIYSYQQLYEFTFQIFKKIGCSVAHAHTATKVLLSADLRGIDSHGIARLAGYVRLWQTQRVNASPKIKIIYEKPSTAVIDGDAGLGLVVAPYAMNVAIQKAKQTGSGWVSVCNSNHFGIAGYHAMLALPHDMIGIAMTNASALVAPTFSIERLLGTNPIAVAIPAHEQPAFVADFATTTASNGKLELLQRMKKEAPLGWVQDEAGSITTNANAVKEGGALLPLGSDKIHGSHKGYALGSIVDIFSALLSGASFGPWVPPFPAYVPIPEQQPGKGIGHFFGAISIDAFRPAEIFKQQMDVWIERFRTAKTVATEKQVLIPGDIERETEAIRFEKGIPLHESVVQELKTLATTLEVSWIEE